MEGGGVSVEGLEWRVEGVWYTVEGGGRRVSGSGETCSRREKQRSTRWRRSGPQEAKDRRARIDPMRG